MASKGHFTINTDGEWKTLAEVTGLTFIEDEKYQLQLDVGTKCRFCEKSTEPEGEEGFTYIGKEERPIPYLVGSEPLYVRNITSDCGISIAKKE